MPVAALILVEPALAGNLGAAIRVAANFGVPRIELVRPLVDPADPEVARWACGADRLVAVSRHQSLAAAAAGFRTVVATASGRGRGRHPVIGPPEIAEELEHRGASQSALVFGNETRGLRKADLERCDLTVRIPTRPEFPVLNVSQAIAVLLAYLSIQLQTEAREDPPVASMEQVQALVEHLRSSLLTIGFLDPADPDRVLRQLRRLLGRAAVSAREVSILRGICSQMAWAATQPAPGPVRADHSSDAGE